MPPLLQFQKYRGKGMEGGGEKMSLHLFFG